MENSTNTSVIPLCPGQKESCYSLLWMVICSLIDIPCLILNIVHFAVLMRVKSLRKNKPLLSVLVSLTVADGWAALSSIVRTKCGVIYMLRRSSTTTATLLSILFHYPFVIKLNLVLLAAIERYISICKPYRRDSLEKHFVRGLCGTWIILAVVVLGEYIPNREHICFTQEMGPTLLHTSSVAPIIFTMSFFLVTNTLSALVLAELHRMSVRTTALGVSSEAADKPLTVVTKYIVTVLISMAICLLPSAIWMLVYHASANSESVIRVFFGIGITVSTRLQNVIGIVDSVVFIVMPEYRRELGTMLCFYSIKRYEGGQGNARGV